MSSPCVLLSRQIVCLRGQCAPEYFPIASARHICGQEEIDSYSSTHRQNDLKKSSNHLKSPLHIPVWPIPFNKHTSTFTYLCVRLHMFHIKCKVFIKHTTKSLAIYNLNSRNFGKVFYGQTSLNLPFLLEITPCPPG